MPALGARGVGSREEVWAPPAGTPRSARGKMARRAPHVRCVSGAHPLLLLPLKCWALAPTAKPVARDGDTASVFPAREQHV